MTRECWTPGEGSIWRAIGTVLLTVFLTWGTLAATYWMLSSLKPRDPLDLNHDGRVTCTDMLIAKRMELQIKARILGEVSK